MAESPGTAAPSKPATAVAGDSGGASKSAPRFDELAYQDGVLVYARRVPRVGSIRLATVEGGVAIANGDRMLTEPFRTIESFDVSFDRGEVVFSAEKDGNLDIGLVSTDGSPISWVPNDPGDEIAVQWAPRGNKISYIVRGPAGDVVRTVHVPTAVALSVPFPEARVKALAWEPGGERYAVSWHSPAASDRVELVSYGGEERKTIVEAGRKLDVDVQPLPGPALLIRPAAMRYGEKLPLVIWKSDDLYRWNDARAQLIGDSRVAYAVVLGQPGAEFWKATETVPWIDRERVFSVGVAAPEPARTILGDAGLTGGDVRRDGRVVRVPPAVVESFAASSIAAELKGTSPANGIHR